MAAVDRTHDIYNRPHTRYDRTLRYFAMVAFDDSRSTTKAADVLVKVHSKAVGDDPVTGKRWEIGELDTVLPVLTEVFLGICEASVRMMLDGSQSWTPEGLALIVGCAAYRALRARP